MTLIVLVNLQTITAANVNTCLDLAVAPSQQHLVADNARSLAQAYADPSLHPLAIYPGDALGYLPPDVPVPMVGFVMYELKGGVGFILRVMVDANHQRMGYGRAAVTEVIRRLRLHPEVEMIATSHRADNTASAALFESLGFVRWPIAWALANSDETYLQLPSA